MPSGGAMRVTSIVLAGVLLVFSAGNASAQDCSPSDLCTVQAAVETACPCASQTSHGQYRSCVAHALRDLGLSKECKKEVKRCSNRSVCGKPGAVACDEESGKCRIRDSAERCESGGGTVHPGDTCCADCAAPTPIETTTPAETATPVETGTPVETATPVETG